MSAFFISTPLPNRIMSTEALHVHTPPAGGNACYQVLLLLSK